MKNQKPEPTRGNGALVLHAYASVPCYDCDEEDHAAGGHPRCSVCGSVDRADCYDDPHGLFANSVAVKTAYSFGDWTPEMETRWAW